MYRTAMYIEKGLYGELVKIGLECLELFDVRIPAKPGLEMVYEGKKKILDILIPFFVSTGGENFRQIHIKKCFCFIFF